MSRYLDPKSDIVFKRIFGDHPKLLISFLNAVLPLPEGQHIESIEYLLPHQVPELPNFKSTVVDVKCKDQYQRSFIVEMQIQWLSDFMKRMLYSTTSAYVRQLPKGGKYEKLCPVYGLGLVADAFSDEPEFYHHFRFGKVHDPLQTLDDIQIIFIELPKFQPKTFKERKLAVLWLRFLSEISENTLKADDELLNNPDIKQALELTETAAYSPEELYAYEAYWDAVRIEKSREDDSFRKGINQGREEGGEEKALQIARTLLAKGLDVKLISESTGLELTTILEVQKLL